ncbi:MAG: NERD domain-containing protein [Alkalibacterium sp.]|nr:NERD domain-containing protein [Alkalibacterium sp.]
MSQLQRRNGLSKEDSDYLRQLQKGFEGEVSFDKKLEGLNDDYLILHDLQLEVNRQTFQIDTLVLSETGIVVYEVKNYQGEYIFAEKEFRSYPYNSVILNPQIQLSRAITLLKILMQTLKIESELSAKVVFVNPTFVLYNCPPDSDVLMPQQIGHHISQMNKQSRPDKSAQKKLAKKFLSLHKTDERFMKQPAYSFKELNKQVTCLECQSILTKRSRRKSTCLQCGFHELNAHIIKYEIESVRLLFPELKLTTSLIYDWCGAYFSDDSIERVLKKYFVQIGSNKGRYYIKDTTLED